MGFSLDNFNNIDLVFFLPQLPPPKDINEDELIRMLESDDPGLYKVPMSLGDPHWVKDKGRCNRPMETIFIHLLTS